MKTSMQGSLFTIKVEQDCQLDDIFDFYYQSRKNRYILYKDKKVKVNQKTCTQNCPLKKGDQIQILLSNADYDLIDADFTDLSVQYEDDLVLIVNKPSGMLVHSDGVNTSHTLSNQVQGYYILEGYDCPVRPIHRLDYETSGLVLFCKIPFFQPWFDQMLKEKKIHREYEAICEGIIKQKKQIINKPIGKDRHESKKMRISSTGKEAKTEIRVIKQYKTYTWVHARLFTGRTHQIRIHLQSIKHPLLSDALYGTKRTYISRHALHASTLTFYHPIKQESITIHCPMPNDMQTLL